MQTISPQMQAQNLTKQERYTENPFIQDTILSVEQRKEYYKNPDEKIVNVKTGELSAMPIVARFRKVENEQFIKIYTGTISSWFDLSRRAQKVLVYIITSLAKDADYVLIDWNRLCDVSGYNSHRPIYAGLAELCEKDIIARGIKPGFYFINPNYLFNGNRMVLVEAIEKKGTEIRNQVRSEIKGINGAMSYPLTPEQCVPEKKEPQSGSSGFDDAF